MPSRGRHAPDSLHDAFDELLCEIFWIVEAAHFEERGLYETTRFSTAPFAADYEATQLHPDAQLEHDVSEDRIPL